ncbi:hypothetical protein N9C35_05075, partial [Flavobacteriaceae bacterium]|nr:hypothetical protein [Flavobacteriaceae bacterium]
IDRASKKIAAGKSLNSLSADNIADKFSKDKGKSVLDIVSEIEADDIKDGANYVKNKAKDGANYVKNKAKDVVKYIKKKSNQGSSDDKK